jgi:hypothetical protein
MPSDIVALSVVDAEVLKQRLDNLVVAVEVAEEKAATARCCVLAARQLLYEEQAAAVDLERQAAAKKLVPGSTSFSTTETATMTASSLYVDTIVANLHIQADTMMEEIHMDSSGPAAAPTTFYSNKMMSAPLSPPRPPGKNNDSGPGNGNDGNNNRHRNNNRCNGGSGGKNNDNGGNRGGNTSSNTTVVGRRPPASNGRRLSWPRRGLTPYRVLSPGSSSCTSRPLLCLLWAGHPGTARAGISSRSRALSAPWRYSRPTTWSMTGLPTRALHTTPLIQSAISSALML